MVHETNNTIVNGGTARTINGIVGRVVTNFLTPIDRDHVVFLVNADGSRIGQFYADDITMTGDSQAFNPMTHGVYQNCLTIFGEDFFN